MTRLEKRGEVSPLTQPHQLTLVTPNMSRDKKELATIIRKKKRNKHAMVCEERRKEKTLCLRKK